MLDSLILGKLFLSRHNFSDLSKPEFSSVNVSKVNTIEEAMAAAQLCENSVKPLEDLDPKSSIPQASFEPNSGRSELVIELHQTLKYSSGSPDCDPIPFGGTETGLASESASFVTFVEEASETGRFNGEEEEAVYDWENLISDSAGACLIHTQENLAGTSLEDSMGSHANVEMHNEAGTCIPGPCKVNLLLDCISLFSQIKFFVC